MPYILSHSHLKKSMGEITGKWSDKAERCWKQGKKAKKEMDSLEEPTDKTPEISKQEVRSNLPPVLPKGYVHWTPIMPTGLQFPFTAVVILTGTVCDDSSAHGGLLRAGQADGPADPQWGGGGRHRLPGADPTTPGLSARLPERHGEGSGCCGVGMEIGAFFPLNCFACCDCWHSGWLQCWLVCWLID